MPIYLFRCTHCTLEFEVSRSMSRAGEPANCPMEGSPADRVFTMPMVGSRSPEPANVPAPPPQADRWSHHGHMHGQTSSDHSHGGGAPPPAPAADSKYSFTEPAP